MMAECCFTEIQNRDKTSKTPVTKLGETGLAVAHRALTIKPWARYRSHISLLKCANIALSQFLCLPGSATAAHSTPRGELPKVCVTKLAVHRAAIITIGT